MSTAMDDTTNQNRTGEVENRAGEDQNRTGDCQIAADQDTTCVICLSDDITERTAL